MKFLKYNEPETDLPTEKNQSTKHQFDQHQQQHRTTSQNNMADSPTQSELEEIRKEEIVALSSIYEDDFTFVDEENESFEIRITCEDDFWWSLTLKISLPLGYPQTEPPILEVFGECLRNDYIQKMYSELADIWVENIGTSIVYLWVEKCRKMLFDAKTVSSLSESASAESDKSKTTTVDDSNMPGKK